MTTIAYLLSALRRHLVMASVLFVLFALGGIAAAYVKKPVFEASGKLLLNTEQLPLSLSRAELPQMGGGMPTVETISTLIEILTARDLMEQLVDDLGEEAFKAPPPSNPLVRSVVDAIEAVTTGLSDALVSAGLIQKLPPREELIEALQARLVVYPVRQSQVVEVALTWPTPQVPEMATSRLLELFLDRIETLNTMSSEQDVFAQQALRAEAELAVAQDRLRSLQTAHDVVNPTLEIQRLAERIVRNEQALSASDAPGAGAGGATPAEGSRIDALMRQLSALQIDLAGAEALYTAEAVAVRELAARMAATQAALDGETARITASLAADRARLASLLEVEDDFLSASRAIDAAAEGLRAYRQAAADRQVMALQQERVRIRVIDQPAVPLSANGPSRLTLVILALFGAAIMASLVTLAIDRSTTTVAAAGGETPPRLREAAAGPTPMALGTSKSA